MKIKENKIENVTFININNENGMVITLSSLGASIYQLETIDKHNRLESVILTPTNLNDFYTNDGYHGKTVGRYSGRIDNARCIIDNKEYVLEKNWNGVNALHGGYKGISFANFDYQISEDDNNVNVIFNYLEKQDLLPGDVNYKITYQISKSDMEFTIFFNATTNKKTIVNLTNHTYFNLSGNGKKTILDHDLKLNCDTYTKLNNDLITIEIEKVNKVMDFTKKHQIGKYINDDSLQKHKALGYDHCFIKKDANKDEIAILYDKDSKRRLTVYSSYPAIVCYTCNYPSSFDFNVLSSSIRKHHSICLECQFVPNGINMDNVDKALLDENQTYNHYIKYRFDVK